MKVCVVIPCRGEGYIRSQVQMLARHGCAVLLCDDNLIDGQRLPPIADAEVLSIPATRRGLAEVYRLGLMHAASKGFDVVVEMDAGGSHSTAELNRLLRPLRDRPAVDAVFGERLRSGRYEGHWRRKWLSQIGTWLFNWRHGTRWADATSGYIAYRRAALLKTHSAPFKATGHWYQSEVRARVLRTGVHAVEVPITYRNSSSRLSWRSILEALRLLIA